MSADVFFWQAQNANKLDRDARELLALSLLPRSQDVVFCPSLMNPN